MVKANGVEHHVVAAGDGPPVVCVHGFPEDWYSFRHQLRGLSGRFTVMAYDLRGVGGSEKPQKGYDVLTMAEDLVALVDALGLERPAVIGHDWGGSIVPVAAHQAKEKFSRMAVINGALGREIRPFNSWYIWAINNLAPWVDGRLKRRDLFPHGIIRFWAWVENQAAFTEEDINHYSEVYHQSGTLEAWLALYRSIWRGPSGKAYDDYNQAVFSRPPVDLTWAAPVKPDIAVPTLLIWGEEDPALPVQLAHRLKRVWGELGLSILPDCGHFPHEEKPDEVNALLLEFLSPMLPR
jgi:pimeloyl-ACP methyl ester carboxylesterase